MILMNLITKGFIKKIDTNAIIIATIFIQLNKVWKKERQYLMIC